MVVVFRARTMRTRGTLRGFGGGWRPRSILRPLGTRRGRLVRGAARQGRSLANVRSRRLRRRLGPGRRGMGPQTLLAAELPHRAPRSRQRVRLLGRLGLARLTRISPGERARKRRDSSHRRELRPALRSRSESSKCYWSARAQPQLSLSLTAQAVRYPVGTELRSARDGAHQLT